MGGDVTPLDSMYLSSARVRWVDLKSTHLPAILVPPRVSNSRSPDSRSRLRSITRTRRCRRGTTFGTTFLQVEDQSHLPDPIDARSRRA